MVAGKITVNGQSRSLTDVPLHTTALDFLRGCGLTGCKEGCAEGECGACSVMVARPGLSTPTEWVAINACLVPIASLDGQEIVTAEGLGEPGQLHPVQEEMAVRGGLAVRLLHAGLRLQHGRRVLPAGPPPPGGERCRARPRARPQRVRPARAEREPLPLHGLPPDPWTRPTPSMPHRLTTRSRPG